MTSWQIRMVEIVAGVVNHADPFHHAPRPNVVWDRKGHNFLEAQNVEPEC